MIFDRRHLKRATKISSTTIHSSYPAKKSLGQNFLVDDNISRKIVAALSASANDCVVEIGPGKGALTHLLATTGATITAIEKDRHLVESLGNEISRFSNVDIVTGDFLDLPFPPATGRLKVVGNIPYNLTSRIISRIVDERERIHSAVLMVQDEVAERLAAPPGTKKYGSISVRLQLFADIELLFIVKPGCFRPRPRVDSRVIRISFRDRSPLGNEEAFVRFIKRAFGMRRKMFRHFVSLNYGKDSVELLQSRFKTSRVETFTPSEIYSLFEVLEGNARHK